MKILIAEDDPVSRCFLEVTLAKWNYEVISTRDGNEAWNAFQRESPPIAILDWMMPALDGAELCGRIRSLEADIVPYLILLTAKSEKGDVVAGLEAGADDYITKPFSRQELRARIEVGLRIGELQKNLAARISELEAALARVKQLQGLLPICSYCKKIRSDDDYWEQVDSYIAKHSEVAFSHSICPNCFERMAAVHLKQKS